MIHFERLTVLHGSIRYSIKYSLRVESKKFAQWQLGKSFTGITKSFAIFIYIGNFDYRVRTDPSLMSTLNLQVQ